MSATEVVKRLTATPETLRELYLKSGNRCAFPGCNAPMLNEKGQFIGQMCHIEAASEGGERFNANQTNEQRRHVSNLLLMCYPHHVETNDVVAFPVERMRRIKEEHEKNFSDIAGAIYRSITDHTTRSNVVTPSSLARMNQVLGWNSSPEDLRKSAAEIARHAKTLSRVPLNARQLFEIILNRSENIGHGIGVTVAEVRQAACIESGVVHEICTILARYDLVQDDGGIDDYGNPMIVVARGDWPLWEEIKEFCRLADVEVAQLVINLDFSVLD